MSNNTARAAQPARGRGVIGAQAVGFCSFHVQLILKGPCDLNKVQNGWPETWEASLPHARVAAQTEERKRTIKPSTLKCRLALRQGQAAQVTLGRCWVMVARRSRQGLSHLEEENSFGRGGWWLYLSTDTSTLCHRRPEPGSSHSNKTRIIHRWGQGRDLSTVLGRRRVASVGGMTKRRPQGTGVPLKTGQREQTSPGDRGRMESDSEGDQISRVGIPVKTRFYRRFYRKCTQGP
jgi:hypothetical protein